MKCSEEENDLPKLENSITVEKSEELARSFERTKMFAPTRYVIFISFIRLSYIYIYTGLIQVHPINHRSKRLPVLWLLLSTNFEICSKNFLRQNELVCQSKSYILIKFYFTVSYRFIMIYNK